MTATGIISNIIYITENQNKPKVAKDFSGLFPLDLYSGLWHFQT